jgi:serine protease Do
MRSTQTSNNRMTGNSDATRRRGGSRAILLGAAAMIAAAGSFGAAQIIPFSSAIAETPAIKAQAFPTFANVIESVRDAVVSVKVTIAEVGDTNNFGTFNGRPMPDIQPGDPLERFFRQFGERGPSAGPSQRRPSPRGPARIRRSQGSGFVISADGYVVTNNHVVKDAKQVKLTFDNGKTVDAKIVGRDPRTDLALLKITEAGNYKFVSFAKTLPRVGDWVVAIGNPFGLGGTVTAGIVSARGRDIGSGPYDDYLQIDAPVNRGNSGGPTFDSQGNVVGVNTAIYSPSGGSVGIGFAIPANVAEQVISSLRDKGSVSRGYLGVQIQPVSPAIAEALGIKENSGALIAESTPGLPADKAGLQSGDIIVSVNGEKIDGPRKLARTIAGINPGVAVKIGYLRKGESRTTELNLASLPDQRTAALSSPRSPATPPAGLDPRFGMTLEPATDVAGAGGQGVVIAELDPSGLAARQGLRSGDVILEAGGKTVGSPTEFTKIISSASGNGRKAILLRVKSGDKTRFVALAFRNRDSG